MKENTAFIAGHQARRMGSSCSKDLHSLMAFSRGSFLIFFVYFLKFSFNWEIINNIAMVLSIHQCESAIGKHMYLPP